MSVVGFSEGFHDAAICKLVMIIYFMLLMQRDILKLKMTSGYIKSN